MWLREALKLRENEIAEIFVRQQIGKNIVAVLVPRANRRLGVVAHDPLEWRIWRIRGEVFIGINVDTGGMIGRPQGELIRIEGFFFRLPGAGNEQSLISTSPH